MARNHNAAAAAAAAAVEFDVSQLPSLRKDKLTIAEESDTRRRTCRYIEEAGRLLKLPRLAIVTAMVFFHRFYAKHAFSEHDRFEMSMAAIILATKVEECPRKVDVVLPLLFDLKKRGLPVQQREQDAKAAGNISKEEVIKQLKERVLSLERVLLHTIGFALSIVHPYIFLGDRIKGLVLQPTCLLEFTPGSDKAREVANWPTDRIREELFGQMMQWSKNFANDSMHTTLCLQFDPEDIATAAVYLAGQYLQVRPVAAGTTGGNDGWMEALGQPDVEILIFIAVQILDEIAIGSSGNNNKNKKSSSSSSSSSPTGVGDEAAKKKATMLAMIKANLPALRNHQGQVGNVARSEDTATTAPVDPSKRRRTE